MADPIPLDRIDAVRRFNRFHTRMVGALDEGLLESSYSLAQVRILYEVAHARGVAGVSAAELGRILGMDAGYISRLVSGLERDGLIARKPSAANAKRLAMRLTREGRAVIADLEAVSGRETAALLGRLSESEQRQLVGAMARIERLIGGPDRGAPVIMRGPEPGDVAWAVHRQAALYAQEYGWDWTFEALVAEIGAQFIREFDATQERCWIAELDGAIAGSVFVVREDDATAKLRMLYVEPEARGLGIGRRLVDECLRFARARGYARMVLWTNDVLTAARHIYERAGFLLLREEPHHSFGHDLVGQYWERDL